MENKSNTQQLKEINFIKRKGFYKEKADFYKGINPLALQSYFNSTTSTARRYLVPTTLGAPGQRVSAAAAVAVVVVEGAAAALRLGVAAPDAAATVLFLAVLLGGPEESEGSPSHRVVTGGGVDLLFRGVDSVPREGVVAATLQFLLEQELEVFPLGLWLVLLGDDPEVELLCIPM